MFNNIVEKSFSRAAKTYDDAAILQLQIADNLVSRIKQKNCSNILDIGSGTGIIAQLLSSRFKDSNIFCGDISFKMLSISKQKTQAFHIRFDCQRLPFKDTSFDLAVSSALYQWVDDLEGAFSQVRRALEDGGSFYFSTFASKTLQELHQSLWRAQAELEINNKIITKRFSAGHEIENFLKNAGFKDIFIETKLIRKEYSDFREILTSLKDTGANISFNRAGLFRRDLLHRTEEIYNSICGNNGCVYATYEVIFVKAR